mgnify:FL=1|tara:strand:+ start:266 stop:439 length:174 start_codon:yes stop_codon:yes gene_type:complete
MDIKLWYSKDMKQWRWTFVDPVSNNHESGQQYHIRDAMNDIATTIENMVDNQQYEGQ